MSFSGASSLAKEVCLRRAVFDITFQPKIAFSTVVLRLEIDQ